MKAQAAHAGWAILLLAAAAGCATISSGTTQTMTINSNVQGARVFLDATEIGTTPFTGVVPRNRTALRVEAEGYRSETVTLSKTLDPAFWGNIIIGGTLGSITDFASGAAYQYTPATYQVELRQADQDEEAFLEQLVVRKFAMLYIDEITRDVATGSGEYLSAMVRLLNLTTDRGLHQGHVARALRQSRGSIEEFGAGVVALL